MHRSVINIEKLWNLYISYFILSLAKQLQIKLNWISYKNFLSLYTRMYIFSLLYLSIFNMQKYS